MADATPVEPIADAVHLSTDMQNIFTPGGLWETPSAVILRCAPSSARLEG